MMFSDKIIDLVKENLEDSSLSVTLESQLEEDLGFDSFATVMLVNAIEDEFDINIDTNLIQETKTVKDIIAKLEEHYPDIAGK